MVCATNHSERRPERAGTNIRECREGGPGKRVHGENRTERKKRTLDANAYMWVLLDKLAVELKTSSDDLYKFFVRYYGKRGVIELEEVATKTFTDTWSNQGTGWFVDDIGPSRTNPGFRSLRIFYGTSVYDTKEMARLIDEVVEECKAQGIETMSKKEIDNLLGGQKNE